MAGMVELLPSPHEFASEEIWSGLLVLTVTTSYHSLSFAMPFVYFMMVFAKVVSYWLMRAIGANVRPIPADWLFLSFSTFSIAVFNHTSNYTATNSTTTTSVLLLLCCCGWLFAR